MGQDTGFDLLAAADWNYALSNVAFLGSSRSGEVVESHGLHIASCGFRARSFNFAWLRPPFPDVRNSIQRAREYFGAHELPFRFMVRSQFEWACADALREAGLHEVLRTPGMILDPVREGAAARADLVVREVESEEDLVRYQETAFAGFGFPAASGQVFLTEALLGMPNVRLYLGLVGARPVCTSALCATGPVAGIYWVATLPDWRGRGFGEAMTWNAVRGGARLGCRFASLQASALGRPVYERMGFATPLHYVCYEEERRGAKEGGA
jgi:GNAT superfamily N-acetyltransferase